MIRSSWNGPDVGIFAYTYELTRSSFAGTFPASQCHVSHAEPVSGGSWAAQSASEIGSLFLFDPPAPEYVVLSVPPFCDVSSLRKAAATPPNVPVAKPLSLPEASNRSPQSGPLAVFPSPRMFAAWTPPSSNRLSSWTACAPATMKIAARTTINTGASRNRRRRRLPVGPRTRVAIRSYLLRVGFGPPTYGRRVAPSGAGRSALLPGPSSSVLFHRTTEIVHSRREDGGDAS